MSWTLDPKYTPRTVSQMRALPRNMPLRPSLTAKPTTLAERIASAVVPDGRKWTDMRNKVQGAIEFATPLGAEQPLRDARSAYQGGNKWGAAGLGALAMLSAIPEAGTEAKAATKTGRGIFGKKGIIAYHGSPHSFDKFSLDKIGTGEGAQAYGHGLYFADNEAVAKAYRDDLTSRVTGNANRTIQQAGGDIDRAIAETKAEMERLLALPQSSRRDGMVALSEQSLGELMAQKAGGGAGKGSMYQVRINASPEDFLDWDKPVGQQPKQVQDAIRYAFGPQDDAAVMAGYSMDKPREVHSRLMRDKGIPGIKYLDQGSRGAGEGSRNYVVFDDALIEILKKYGVAVPAMGLGLAGMSRQNEGGM